MCKEWTVNRAVRSKKKVRLVSGSGRQVTALCPINVRGLKVVRCGFCREYMVVTKKGVVWPPPVSPVSKVIPEKIAEAYTDVLRGHTSGARLGALLSARTTLYRLMHDMGVSRLDDLLEQGHITSAASDGVNQIRRLANIAAHEDIDTGMFSNDDVSRVLEFLRRVLDTVYTEPHRARQLASITSAARSNARST